MTNKFLFVCMLMLATAACSGQRDDEVGSECLGDEDCANGASCENGFCTGDDAVEPRIDSGMDTVEAASGAEGAPPGTEVVVETEGCTGTSCEIPAGGRATFRAPSVEGYRFTGWSGNDPRCMGTNPELTLDPVEANVRCIANYVKRVTVSGAGGELSASSEGPFAECAAASCEVDQGSTVVITASEREGFRFDGFTGAGCSDVEGLAVTVLAGASDVSCTASYVATVRITGAIAGAEGSVLVAAQGSFARCTEEGCTVDVGDAVTLTAPAIAGYRFTGWSGSEACSGSEPALSLADVSMNLACVAGYVQRFVITGEAEGASPEPVLSAASPDAFTTCSEGACEVDAGGTVTLVAPSVSGYRFTGFTGDGCENAVGSTVTISDVAADVTCVAHYLEGIAVIGNVVGAEGTVRVEAESPQEPCSAGACVIDEGSDVRLTAPTLAGYRFLGWSGAGPSDAECTGSALVLQLVAVSDSKTCNANYVARVRVAGVANPAGAGEVGASSSAPAALCDGAACTVDSGSTVSLSAVAAAGQRFTGWSGGGVCTGGANPLVLANVSSQVTCTANFVGRFTVRFPEPANGSVVASNVPATAQCNGTSCVVDRGASLRLTASADASYRFTAWSGCSTSANPILDLANITANQTCTANFVRLVVVTYSAGSGGSVSAPGGQCPGGSPCTLDAGANLDVTATPSAGYRFDGWSGAGCTDATPASASVANLVGISANVTCAASFTRQVTVTYAAGAGGSVSAPGGQCPTGSPCTLDAGANLDVTASANSGFRFSGWAGTGCTDSVPATANVADLANITANVTCSASFTRQVTITYSAGSGGSVSAPGGQCPTGSPCTLDAGANLDVTAVPGAGYRFDGWAGTGCTDSVPATANVADLANITANVTCSASFTRQVTITYSAGSGGSVSAPGGQCPTGSPCTLDAGANLDVTAVPGAGYRFDGWAGTGCTDSVPGTANVADLANIGANVTCSASFTRQVTVTYSAGSGGSVSAPGGQCPTGSPCTLDTGANLDVTAVPGAGYRFDGWSGAGCTDASPASASVANLVGITANVTCAASFTRQVSVTYNAGTGGSVSAPGGQCPAGSPCTLDSGANLDVTATVASGYRFAGWSGAGCNDANTASATVANLVGITANVTCTASFIRQVTVTYSATAGGAVSAPTGQCPDGSPCTLDSGANLDVTAVASSGFRFSGWAGTGCTDSVPATANVADLANITANVTCTASFSRQVTVTYSAGTGGSVSAPGGQCPDGSPCTLDSGANVDVTAVASTGFRFSGWAGTGCTDSVPATANVADLANITANVTCTASFSRQVTVTYSAGTGGSVSAPGGQCPDGSPCTLDSGANLDVTAVASTGFRFSGWAGTGCTDSVPATANVADLANITANVTCTASFSRQVTVTYSAGTGGSVSAPGGQCPDGSPCTLDSGANLDVTAVASSGFRFSGWAGTGCTDSVPATANVADLANITSNVTCTASFTRQVTVTYSAGTGGTVSAPGGQCPDGSPCTLDAGANLDVTAVASTGFRFSGWAGTGCTDSVPATANVADLANITANITCTASFTRQFTVTYSAGTGGSVSAPAASCPDGSPCTVDADADLAITAVAGTGFRFNGFTGTGCTDSTPSTPAIANLTGIAQNVTCTASFTRQFIVTYSAGTGGTVSAPAGQCPNGSPCTLDTGANLAITATPGAGFVFGAWSGCVDSNTGTPAILDLSGLSANVTCTASFLRRLSVSYAASPASAGAVTAPIGRCPSGSPCAVDSGSALALTATANAGFRFLGWSGTGCTDTVLTTPNVADLANITSDVTCTASYATRVTVAGVLGATAPGGVSIAATSSSAGASCSGASCTVDTGSAATLTASVAPTGFVFRGFTGTGCTDANPDGNVNTLQLTNVTANRTCTADYRQRITISVAATPASVAGLVTVSASDPNAGCLCNDETCSSCTVDAGTTVTVRALERVGRLFSSWSGAAGCASTDPSHPFTALSSATCTANFFGLWARGYRNGSAVQAVQGVLPFEDGTIGLAAMASTTGGRTFQPRRMIVDERDGALVPNSANLFDHDAAWTVTATGSHTATDIVGKTDSYVVYSTYSQVEPTGLAITRPLLMFQERNVMSPRPLALSSNFGNTFLTRGAQLESGDHLGVGYIEGSPDNGVMARFTASGGMQIAQTMCVANLASVCTRASCLPTRMVDVEPFEDGFASLAYGTRPLDNTTINMMVVQRWDANGRLLAEGHYEPGFNVDPYGLVVTPDGGYLIVGRVREPDAAAVHYQGFWIKLRPDFELQWMGQLGREGFDDFLMEGTVSPDRRSLVLAGTTYNVLENGAGQDAWIVQLDLETGALLQQLSYGTPGTPLEIFYDVKPMFDGTYVAAGLRSNDGYMPLAMRLDESLQLSFNSSYRAELNKTDYELNEKVVDRRTWCPSFVTRIDASIGAALQPTYTDPSESYEILAP